MLWKDGKNIKIMGKGYFVYVVVFFVPLIS